MDPETRCPGRRGGRSALRGPRLPAPAVLCLVPIALLSTGVALRESRGGGRIDPAGDLLPFPGGFLETAATGLVRPRLSLVEILGILPERGAFVFPPPYGTSAVRLTHSGDCAGGDCVNYVGYSYWRNINNHVGRDEMLIMLGLDRARGGPGPSLFSYDKTTDRVLPLGPLFDPSSDLSRRSGEGWYFSATDSARLYVDDGARMIRYDVLTRESEIVFDVTSRFGPDAMIRQMHSSDDDRVHSATLLSRPGLETRGCVVYHEDTGAFQHFPKIGDFNECHVDKSGRWLVSLENVDRRHDLEMRVFDILTGEERLIWDQAGAAGHADMGHGYVLGADDWNLLPNAILRWDLSGDPLTGLLVSHNTDWSAPAPNHLAHGNARPDVPPERQYACGSGASRAAAVWANEIICFRLDGSLDVLVVAPVMTDLDAPGGGSDYGKVPKGNLDVTGQYFVWTSNAGGDRLDAFLVKVPAHLLSAAPMAAPPPSLVVSDAPDPVAAGGLITYTLTYSNPSGVDLTGVVLRDRLPPSTGFVSATGGGLESGGVVTWEIGALPAGGSGSVRMTVRVPAPPPPPAVIVNGITSLGSNESATTTGPQATTAVVVSAAPAVVSVVETGTNSIYVLQGGRFTLRVEGANFQQGALVDLGPDLEAGAATLAGPESLTVPVSVPAAAALGTRDATVTNPDSLSGGLPDAPTVVKTADINRDCRIDAVDLNVLARAWNTAASEPGFLAAADLDGDDYVGPLDLAILAAMVRVPLAGARGETADQPPLALHLLPGRSEVSPGDQLWIEVVLVGGREITGVPFHVRFDPGVLEYVSARPGPALLREAVRPVLLASVNPRRPGDLAVGLSMLGTSGAFSGSGTLVLLGFRALRPGESELTFERASVRGATGGPLPARLEGCTVSVR